ncbi:Detected protein of unknown function [Hibiscus syriacus]|uniref:Cytochrome P450 78A7-like n=1 Tax=Hibiscus syriacus TaxID=106335 RepID=A0A6A3AC91_HIBSY|nr:Detected protein of unknown function [Hibiscus syriacus]
MLKGSAEETNNEVESRFIRLEDMIQALRESIEGMREDVALCKRAVISGGANITVSTPRVECPKPQGFNGARDAKEVENYLWQMEQYFEGIDLNDEAAKIHGTSSRKNSRSTAIPRMWSMRLARNCGRWAKQEIHRRDIRTVDEAIAIAESLIDFQPYSHTITMKNKDKYPAKGWGERWENNQGNRDRDHQRSQAKEGDRDRRPGQRDYEEKKKSFVPKGGCFLCKGPHPMSSCPKLGSLSAIVDHQDTESQAEMGSLQVLNALKAKSLTPTPSNGLMYVEAVINEKLTRAMVDTGATHNFVSKDEANRLGLKYTGSTGWLKMVTAIPMFSFSSVCILEKGSPFMVPVVEAPKEQGRDAKQLSAIQLGRGIKKGAMKLGRGIKKGAMTYLTMLKEDDEIEKTNDLPLIIREVLEENKDAMPPELPNKLLPMREVDHKIELEPGAKPPALAPYRMASPELEEFRRKLKELIDTGKIRPSKAPYGAPVLFQKKHDGLLRMCVYYRALNKFMVVYLDDIVVYSNSMEENIDHLRIVFKILRENELYVKKEKCTFSTEEIYFLGHVIGHGKLLMDGNKIEAIREWEPPTKVSEMRSFLGLVNYYRRFIRGYSARASPLTDLLKKGKTWEWSEQYQKAFEDLKAAVSQEPVLALPDFTMPFEVYTDASDFAIGGVLMQEGHPIAFESHLEEAVTKTSPVVGLLAEFDYTLEYKPGKANFVADALSRKAELTTISLAKGTVLEHIKEGLEQDPMTRELVKLARDGKTQQFWVEDVLLYTKGLRIYVPKWDNLRRDLIKECHDTKWAGHPGQKRTMALLAITYFWPHIKDSVELYVKTCLVHQQDKVENRQPVGLLEPLPVPQRPWDSITLDFISALPKSEGYGWIMVVVDRFSKYGTFIPFPKDCTAEEAAREFFKNVMKHWGLTKSIISDRDPRFTGHLWTELFKLLGTELNFSTSFHPQTDGQTEWVNVLLECYLQYFGKSLGAAKMAKSWEENPNIARACLEKARIKMKKWADEKRRHREFTFGDLVLVKLLPQQFKALRSVHKRLIRRYEGPFQVLSKVGKVSYRLDLPSTLKIHPVFHISMLKPYHADKEDPSRGYSHRAPPVVTKSYDKEVETVLTSRTVRKRGVPPRTEYLIKWKGLPESEATWELAEDLWQFAEHLKVYETTRTTPK